MKVLFQKFQPPQLPKTETLTQLIPPALAPAYRAHQTFGGRGIHAFPPPAMIAPPTGCSKCSCHHAFARRWQASPATAHPAPLKSSPKWAQMLREPHPNLPRPSLPDNTAGHVGRKSQSDMQGVHVLQLFDWFRVADSPTQKYTKGRVGSSGARKTDIELPQRDAVKF